MRKTLTTAALVLALCCTAFAGEVHTPGAPTTPPTTTADGEMPNGVTDTLTQIALDVLASVLL